MLIYLSWVSCYKCLSLSTRIAPLLCFLNIPEILPGQKRVLQTFRRELLKRGKKVPSWAGQRRTSVEGAQGTEKIWIYYYVIFWVDIIATTVQTTLYAPHFLFLAEYR
jgi:hypothetical protein